MEPRAQIVDGRPVLREVEVAVPPLKRIVLGGGRDVSPQRGGLSALKPVVEVGEIVRDDVELTLKRHLPAERNELRVFHGAWSPVVIWSWRANRDHFCATMPDRLHIPMRRRSGINVAETVPEQKTNDLSVVAMLPGSGRQVVPGAGGSNDPAKSAGLGPRVRDH